MLVLGETLPNFPVLLSCTVVDQSQLAAQIDERKVKRWTPPDGIPALPSAVN